MLTIRKRGAVYHCRGIVRVGQERRIVGEHSTGCAKASDAEAYRTALDARLRNEIAHGGPSASAVSINQATTEYMERPGGVPPMDVWRVNELADHVGSFPLSDLYGAWQQFIRVRGQGLKASTLARFRGALMAVANHSATLHRFAVVPIPAVAGADSTRLRYLTTPEQDRLLSAYRGSAQDVAYLLCFQGMRSREATSLLWSDIDRDRWTATIRGGETKNAKSRTLPLHSRVVVRLQAILARLPEGEAPAGTVIKTAGKAYFDTRNRGGNAIKTAHRGATARAGIEDFRPHDWRHHWASHMAMGGCDITTLMELGGWDDPKMVRKYVSLADTHKRKMTEILK